MSVATFDTLAAVRNLEKAGMGTTQAEAVTETIRIAVFQGVATGEDLGELRTEMNAEFGKVRAETGGLRAEMNAEFGKVRAETGELRAEMNAEFGKVRAEIGELRAEMSAENARLRVDFEKLRADLTWRMMLIVGAMLGLFTALDRLVLN